MMKGLMFVLATLGCSHAAPVPTASYATKGQLVELPTAEATRPQVEIHHEAIKNFRTRTGKVSEMPSMTMSFDVPPTVSLVGLAKGDKVSFTFEVTSKDGRLRLENLDKLPPSTVLVLE